MTGITNVCHFSVYFISYSESDIYNFSTKFLKKDWKTLDFDVKSGYIKNIERNLIMKTKIEFFDKLMIDFNNKLYYEVGCQLVQSNYSFVSFFDYYLDNYDPTKSEIIFFVQQLTPFVVNVC